MFRKLIGGLVGALLVVSLHGTARADPLNLDVGDFGGEGNQSISYGYWFTAPVDFVIDSVFLASDSANELTTLEVFRLNAFPEPFPSSTLPLSPLGFWSGVASQPTNIAVSAGWIIGVLGYDGFADYTPLRDDFGPKHTIMGDDLEVTLNPLRFNSYAESVFAEGDVVFTDPADQIGLIGMTYHVGTVAAVPEPETYAMLLAGLGLLGFAARRRKQKELAAA